MKYSDVAPPAVTPLPNAIPHTQSTMIGLPIRSFNVPRSADSGNDRIVRLDDISGAGAGLEAELTTGFTETARMVLWACFEDYGLAPMGAIVEFDGVSAGSYAHCRLPAYNSKDPYSDIIVHEAAHLLHYLKPERFGLQVPTGKERFVDVDFNTGSYSPAPAKPFRV